MITEPRARRGSVSQPMRVWMRPSLKSDQLSTLNVGSNIHFQAKVESTVGTMKGRSIEARTRRLPRKWRFRGGARPMPRGGLPTGAMGGETKGVLTAPREVEAFQNLT